MNINREGLDAKNVAMRGYGGDPIVPSLRAAGFDPASVDVVAMSHLHFDHAGGLLRADGERAFPHAKIVAQRAEWEVALGDNPRLVASYVQPELRLVEAWGKQGWVDGEREILPGVSVVPTGGHSTGHQAVVVRGTGNGARTLAFFGDLMMRPWAANPRWVTAFDDFPLDSVTRKAELFAQGVGQVGEDGDDPGGAAGQHAFDPPAPWRATVLHLREDGAQVLDVGRLVLADVRHHAGGLTLAGDQVVVVISAMGKETDELLRLASEVSDVRPGREMDMLITAGERKATALLCMALHDLGIHADSFTGSQAGFITDTNHTDAKILDVFVRASGSGFSGNGCVGEVFTNASCGTGRSSTGTSAPSTWTAAGPSALGVETSSGYTTTLPAP